MSGVDPIMGIVVPYVNFLIFLSLAIYFFRTPVSKSLEARQKAFVEAMQAAQKGLSVVEAENAKLRARVGDLTRELESLRDDLMAEARREAARTKESAERWAEHLRAEAARIGAQEVTEARERLRAEMIHSALAAARVRVERELGEPSQKKIVQRAVSGLRAYL